MIKVIQVNKIYNFSQGGGGWGLIYTIIKWPTFIPNITAVPKILNTKVHRPAITVTVILGPSLKETCFLPVGVIVEVKPTCLVLKVFVQVKSICF